MTSAGSGFVQETAFVHARRKDAAAEDSLFYLPDGRAEELRAFTKTSLQCPVPGCPNPKLTTVRRKHLGRRDGFRHDGRGQAEHAPESIQHERAKVAVAQAAMKRHPEVKATIEHATTDGSRRADVMLTWPNGRQVAVEIQYSNLPILAWEERHESYRRQGINDVWLMDRNRLRGEGDTFEALELETTMLAARSQVAWIDIDRGKLAMAYHVDRLPRPTERFSLWPVQLTDVDWSQDGMMPQHWSRLVARLEDLESEEARQEEVRRVEEERAACEHARISGHNRSFQEAVIRVLVSKVTDELPGLGVKTTSSRLPQTVHRKVVEVVGRQFSDLTYAGLEFQEWVRTMALAEKGKLLRIPEYTSELLALKVRVRDPKMMNLCVYGALKPLAESGLVKIHPDDVAEIHQPWDPPWMTHLDAERRPTAGRDKRFVPPATQVRRLCLRCGLPLDDAIKGDFHIVDDCDSTRW